VLKLGNLGGRLLLAFLLVSLVPLVATVASGYWRTQAVVEGLLSENIGKTAQVYAANVDDFLAEQRTLLGTLGASLPAEDSQLAAAVSRAPAVEELIVIDQASGRLAGSQPKSAPWVMDACAAQIARDDLAMTHVHGGSAHEVVVSVPWKGLASLCGRVSFTLHQDMLSERARSAFKGTAYIVDQSGQVVCHAFHEHEPHIAPGHDFIGPGRDIAKTGEAWFGQVTVNGERRLAAYAPSATLPWGVWTEVPVSVVAEPTQPLLIRGLVFGGVLAITLVVAVLLIVRSFTEPIRKLEEAALRDAVAKLDQKVAQRTEELQQARDFSDTLLDTLDDRIVVIDAYEQVIRANDAARRAYGPDMAGFARAEGSATRAVLTSGQPASKERVRDVDGRIEILAVDAFPLTESGGVIAIERDVTEIKEFQAHLVHQEKMAALGTLSAGLAHEIGNPLASMSSELEMLETGWDADEAKASMPVLRQQIQRISRLLRELVDFGRQSRNKQEPIQLLRRQRMSSRYWLL
jgi:signal transduction histidine kinase